MPAFCPWILRGITFTVGLDRLLKGITFGLATNTLALDRLSGEDNSLGWARSVQEDDDIKPGYFSFGSNWERFVQASLSKHPLSGVSADGRVHYMASSLQASFGLQSFEGHTFLDIGCGSGLASLAALTLKASSVISVDAQPASIRATLALRSEFLERAGELGNAEWKVLQGSILDDEFLTSLPQSYLIYSYGVLHHTEDVWKAFQNLAKLLMPDGLLFVALHVLERAGSESERQNWLSFKQEFNMRPTWMQDHYLVAWVLSELSGTVNECLADRPEKPSSFRRFSTVSFCLSERFHQYAGGRGMDFLTDARDWLGGYPYTWVRADEIIRFCGREVQPRLKTLQVQHTDVAGFLFTPADQGTVHYFNYVGNHPTGHWWSRITYQIPSSQILPWNEYMQLCEDPGGSCVERLGVESCYAHAQALTANVHEEVHGTHCFAYLFPDADLLQNTTLQSHFEDGSSLLENMDLLGWGEPSNDGFFCAQSGGSRFRFYGSGLIIFSVWDGSDPRTNGRLYHLLLSAPYTASLQAGGLTF